MFEYNQEKFILMSKLQEALNGKKSVSAMKDKKMHVYTEGKYSYVNLVVSDGAVYAASLGLDLPIIGKVIITNMKMLAGREVVSTDSIKFTDILPNMVIGEICVR